MNIESLLKSISELIGKNERFFIDNPEVFNIVEDRLHKAIDYEDYEGEEEENDEDPYGAQDDSGISSLFDNVDESDIDDDMDGDLDQDEAEKWLTENEDNLSNAEDTDGDGDIDLSDETKQKIETTDKVTDKKKVSSGGYRDWIPKDSYEDHHQEAIDGHMAGGYSHREAERLAGAHDDHSSFQDALRSKINPTQPSDKMLSEMKGLSADWLRNAERQIGKDADAKKQPIKYASSKALTSHEDTHGNFKTTYDEFLGSDDIKDLRGRDRAKAIRGFKEQYHSDNPDHRENAIASADSGKEFGSAMDERKQHLEEGAQDIMDAGKVGDSAGSASEYSVAASGGMDNMTNQGAAQMAGGTQEEGGYSSGVVKDPSLHFAESNPEYVKGLKNKLASKLNPEQTQRMSAVTSIKKKGSK